MPCVSRRDNSLRPPRWPHRNAKDSLADAATVRKVRIADPAACMISRSIGTARALRANQLTEKRDKRVAAERTCRWKLAGICAA